MKDLPRVILKDMIGRYGSSLVNDPGRCEGLLRDTCGSCNREIFVLINAARLRVPADLIAPRRVLPLSLMKGFLAKRLQDELGLSDEASRWAVESWADALGVTDPDTKDTVPTPPVPSSPAFPNGNLPADNPQCVSWVEDLRNGTLPSRLEAVSGLSHTPGAGSIRALIEALGNSEFRVREAAFDALLAAGEPAIPVLSESLPGSRDEIAWRTALVLGGLHARAAVPGLTGLMNKRGKVQVCALWALGEIGDREAVTPLMKYVDHPDPLIKKEALAALKKIGQV